MKKIILQVKVRVDLHRRRNHIQVPPDDYICSLLIPGSFWWLQGSIWSFIWWELWLKSTWRWLKKANHSWKQGEAGVLGVNCPWERQLAYLCQHPSDFIYFYNCNTDLRLFYLQAKQSYANCKVKKKNTKKCWLNFHFSNHTCWQSFCLVWVLVQEFCCAFGIIDLSQPGIGNACTAVL